MAGDASPDNQERVQQDPPQDPPQPAPLPVPKDVAPVALPPPVKALQLYSESLKEEILDHYIQGLSLRKISLLPAMPTYGSLLRWVQHNENFRRGLQEAACARAMHFADEALDEAMSAMDKDDAPAARLRYDALRWRAETEDPNKYGKRTTIAGDPDKPIVFLVRTGVPDPGEHQKPPELEKDGLRKAVIDVTQESLKVEVADADADADAE